MTKERVINIYAGIWMIVDIVLWNLCMWMDDKELSTLRMDDRKWSTLKSMQMDGWPTILRFEQANW